MTCRLWTAALADCGRWLCPTLWYYHASCLYGLRQIPINITQNDDVLVDILTWAPTFTKNQMCRSCIMWSSVHCIRDCSDSEEQSGETDNVSNKNPIIHPCSSTVTHRQVREIWSEIREVFFTLYHLFYLSTSDLYLSLSSFSFLSLIYFLCFFIY
jgi:hypothetical protein